MLIVSVIFKLDFINFIDFLLQQAMLVFKTPTTMTMRRVRAWAQKKKVLGHVAILCNVGNLAPFFSNGGTHTGHLFNTSTGSNIVVDCRFKSISETNEDRQS